MSCCRLDPDRFVAWPSPNKLADAIQRLAAGGACGHMPGDNSVTRACFLMDVYMDAAET
jgi:hypothetical protein